MTRGGVAERDPSRKEEGQPSEPAVSAKSGSEAKASFSTSRLLLQRLAPARLHRHYTHALFRIAMLLAADFLTYRGLHFVILSVRDTAAGAWALNFLWASRPEFPGGGWNFAAALTLGLALTGAYSGGDNWTEGRRIFQGVLLASALTFWGSFWLSPLLPAAISFSVTLAIVTTAVYFQRQLLDLIVSRASLRASRRVIFIGHPTSPMGLEVQEGFLDGTRMTSLGWLVPLEGHQVEFEGEKEDIWDVLQRIDVDICVLSGNFPAKQFRDFVHAASTAGCRIVSPSRYGHLLRTHPAWFRGAPVMELALPVLKKQQLILKRLTDIFVSAFGLVLLSPLLLLIAIRIKFDSPGPVLFSQERVGHGGASFACSSSGR